MHLSTSKNKSHERIRTRKAIGFILSFITHIHPLHPVLPQLFLVFQEHVAYLGFFGSEDINIGLLALNDQAHALRCHSGNSGSYPFIISSSLLLLFLLLLSSEPNESRIDLSTVSLSHVGCSRLGWGWGASFTAL